VGSPALLQWFQPPGCMNWWRNWKGIFMKNKVYRGWKNGGRLVWGLPPFGYKYNLVIISIHAKSDVYIISSVSLICNNNSINYKNFN
jgi:hypothetical protein